MLAGTNAAGTPAADASVIHWQARLDLYGSDAQHQRNPWLQCAFRRGLWRAHVHHHPALAIHAAGGCGGHRKWGASISSGRQLAYGNAAAGGPCVARSARSRLRCVLTHCCVAFCCTTGAAAVLLPRCFRAVRTVVSSVMHRTALSRSAQNCSQATGCVSGQKRGTKVCLNVHRGCLQARLVKR